MRDTTMREAFIRVPINKRTNVKLATRIVGLLGTSAGTTRRPFPSYCPLSGRIAK